MPLGVICWERKEGIGGWRGVRARGDERDGLGSELSRECLKRRECKGRGGMGGAVECCFEEAQKMETGKFGMRGSQRRYLDG